MVIYCCKLDVFLIQYTLFLLKNKLYEKNEAEIDKK